MILATETQRLLSLQRYQTIRSQTEKICRPLLPEDTVVQPIVDVSPPKWHLAHTSWFFENFILKPHLPHYQLFHPDYGFLFNSYYNNVGNRVQRHLRGTLTRPSLEDVYAYRAHVDKYIRKFVETADEELQQKLAPVFELGMQHEQQHQELLLTDIKYILSTNPLLPEYQPSSLYQSAQPNLPKPEFLKVPGGLYTIGYQGINFHFDNEKGIHQVYLQDFEVQNCLVTNAEYLEFMQDGGYSNFGHWLDEGWGLVKQEKWQAPLYWVQQNEKWYRFTHHGLQPLNLAAPVTHISFYEANAYASWAGKRLLTEFEWEAVTQVYPPKAEEINFAESENYDPQPLAPDAAPDQCHQLLGSAWEWTYSAYHPYPNYAKADGAIGEYNGKFMINQMVLRGGSCSTPFSHIRTSYRNFFHPDKRWQFTGIRLAQ